MELSFHRQTLTLRSAWSTTHGSATSKQTLVVAVAQDGICGHGEVVPVSYHGQSLESAESTLGELISIWPRWREPGFSRLLVEVLDGQSATVCGLDAALWDLAGQRLGRAAHHVLRTADPHTSSDGPAVTSMSIGLGDPDATVAKVAEALALGFTALKIKLGTGTLAADDDLLRTIREMAPQVRVRVDANGGWRSADDAFMRIAALMRHDIEFVEQPLPPGRLADTATLRTRLAQLSGERPLLMLDEDCVSPRDLELIIAADAADAVNIKLSKCGGMTTAWHMLRRARSAGLRTMLGCMIESSLGIAAAAQLSPWADFLDLDAHLLLADGTDPWQGLRDPTRPAAWLNISGIGLGVVQRG